MINFSEQILVVGTGGHARFVIAVLKKVKRKVKGLITLDSDYDPEELILNHKIIGAADDLPTFFAEGFKTLVLALGDNKTRMEIYDKWSKFGFSFPSVIDSDATVHSSASMGPGNIIGPKAVIGAKVTIGENNILNSSCVIEHETLIANHCHIAPGAVLCGRVIVGEEVMVGANSTIIDHIEVQSKTVLGAGSTLISSNSTKGETLVGSPAKRVLP